MNIVQYLDEHYPWKDTAVTLSQSDGSTFFAGVYLWENMTHRRAGILEIQDVMGKGRNIEEIISDFESVTIDTVSFLKFNS